MPVFDSTPSLSESPSVSAFRGLVRRSNSWKLGELSASGSAAASFIFLSVPLASSQRSGMPSRSVSVVERTICRPAMPPDSIVCVMVRVGPVRFEK